MLDVMQMVIDDLKNGRKTIRVPLYPCGIPYIDSSLSYSCEERARVMELCDHLNKSGWCDPKLAYKCGNLKLEYVEAMQAYGNRSLKENEADIWNTGWNIPVSKITTNHIGKTVAVVGKYIRKLYPLPRRGVTCGAFECRKCGHITQIKQDCTDDKLIEPLECEACGRKKPFKLNLKESTRVDEQKFVLVDDSGVGEITVIVTDRRHIDSINVLPSKTIIIIGKVGTSLIKHREYDLVLEAEDYLLTP